MSAQWLQGRKHTARRALCRPDVQDFAARQGLPDKIAYERHHWSGLATERSHSALPMQGGHKLWHKFDELNNRTRAHHKAAMPDKPES